MDTKKNNTKKYVGAFILGMIILSFVVGYIMSINLNTDVSKTRLKLTREYKKYKDEPFNYDREKGKSIYKSLCARCHNLEGTGSFKFPPLKDSNIVLNEEIKLIKIVLFGMRGEINRNGKTYNSVMPGFKSLPHEDLAHVLTFIKTELNNSKQEVLPIEVIKAKVDFILKKGPYLESQL